MNPLCLLCRFSHLHQFEKPNDQLALKLMNACATSVLEEFPDVVFSYGVSDEYRYLPHGTFHLLNLIIFFCFPLQLEIVLRGFPFFSFIFKNTTDVHSRCSRYVLSLFLSSLQFGPLT